MRRPSWAEAHAERFSHTAYQLIDKLAYCCRSYGNMIVNLGPRADGSIAAHEEKTMRAVGAWIRENSEVVYGICRRGNGLGGTTAYADFVTPQTSSASAKGNTVYMWNYVWPKNSELIFSGYLTKPRRVYSVKTGEEIAFDHKDGRIFLRGLPKEPFDTILGVSVIALEFDEMPKCCFCHRYPQLTDGYSF